jgi:hypothetical protein
VRVSIEKAETRLLDKLAEEMLSAEGVTLLKKRIREHVRNADRALREQPKPQAAQVASKRAEIEQIRGLMKAGALSQVVAQAAIEKAQEEVRAIERLQPAREERDASRVIRMLPRAAETLRQRVSGGSFGLHDPRSIVQARNTLFRCSAAGFRCAVRRSRTARSVT